MCQVNIFKDGAFLKMECNPSQKVSCQNAEASDEGLQEKFGL